MGNLETLSPSQKQELATSLAAIALFDGGAEIDSEKINSLLTATNNTVESYIPVLFSSFVSKSENAMESMCSYGTGGGGGGGGAAAGGAEEAAVEEEEEEEEEEMDLGGGMDMFGGDEGDGDY